MSSDILDEIKLENINNQYLENFISRRASYYIEHYERKTITSFSLIKLFFGVYWFLYRKMYLYVSMFFLLFLFFGTMFGYFYDILELEPYQYTIISFFSGFIILNIIAAFFNAQIYIHFCLDKIQQVKLKTDLSEDLLDNLSKYGGVEPLLPSSLLFLTLFYFYIALTSSSNLSLMF